MKHIKLFEQFISEEDIPKLSRKDIFIPRRLKERWDDLLIHYLNKGYTKEQIFVAKPFNELIFITKNNIEDFKNIKVIIGNVRLKEINNLKELNLEEVTGFFGCCYYNNNLTSLEGSPKIVGGDFDCSDNYLTSLEGAPTAVGEYFNIENNTKKFTVREVRKVIDVKGKVYV